MITRPGWKKESRAAWPGLRDSERLLNDALKLQSRTREKLHRPPGLGGVKDCEKGQSSLNIGVLSSLLGLRFVVFLGVGVFRVLCQQRLHGSEVSLIIKQYSDGRDIAWTSFVRLSREKSINQK